MSSFDRAGFSTQTERDQFDRHLYAAHGTVRVPPVVPAGLAEAGLASPCALSQRSIWAVIRQSAKLTMGPALDPNVAPLGPRPSDRLAVPRPRGDHPTADERGRVLPKRIETFDT